MSTRRWTAIKDVPGMSRLCRVTIDCEHSIFVLVHTHTHTPAARTRLQPELGADKGSQGPAASPQS